MAAHIPEWTESEQRVIRDFVRGVRACFQSRAKNMILYGSRARGDADEESDYDFLVLLEPFEDQDKRRLSDLADEISYQHCTVLVALAIPLSDFTEERYFYFYENVCKEGIEL